jgi:hypothetical protein
MRSTWRMSGEPQYRPSTLRTPYASHTGYPFLQKKIIHMSDTPPVGAFAIVPSNNLPAAIPFWERLGFARSGGDANYITMTGWGCEVHLTQAGAGPWRIPEETNPFGVFIRTPDVDAIAARVDDLIIRPGGVLGHRTWGLYEVGINGPDGLLVRIGWPSRLIRQSAESSR